MLAVANSRFALRYYDTLFHNKLYAGRRRFITQYVGRFPLPDPDTATAREVADVTRRLVTTRDGHDAMERHVDELVDRAFGVGSFNR